MSDRRDRLAAVAADLARDEEGQGLVEYGLILMLVALVVVGAVTTVGTSLSGLLQTIADALP